MTAPTMPRVMWLLNHTAARKFEVSMLKSIGISEIFLPKSYPQDPSFRSASIDWAEDQHLAIPAEALAVLNAQDWYGTPSREAWEIANRYFDIVFFILHNPKILESIAKHFQGIAMWRAYGVDISLSYSKVLEILSNGTGKSILNKLGNRFVFAEAYAHLADIEASHIAQFRQHLPLGLNDCSVDDSWQGTDKRMLFVCPDIGFNSYYKKIYTEFRNNFSGIPYVVAGAQPINVSDPNVIGFVPRETHERNMREMRVMFYHSTEPNHIHYHPFEAIRAGMPLVFMGGGLLDKLGGTDQPGRCITTQEARRKVRRILDGDRALIESIRKNQIRMLDPMRPENCQEAWRQGFAKILALLNTARAVRASIKPRKRRIAVIVPVGYRGGSLRGAKLLAQAIELGSQQAGDAVEVVFGHLDDPTTYDSHAFGDLPQSIRRRPFIWRVLPQAAAHRAMTYAGFEQPLPGSTYTVPDDGIQQFTDCDLWVIVSDRVSLPLLPIRPYVLMVYDYLQRYSLPLSQEQNQAFLALARAAERVLVTSEFTRQDALQFVGLPNDRVTKVPMLAPSFVDLRNREALEPDVAPYFLWTTNLAAHKNHENAVKALRAYYTKYQGRLDCRVSGVDTDKLLKADHPHLAPLRAVWKSCPALKRHLKVAGELADEPYQSTLADARFLWHQAAIDNGTFSVVEAAQLGVPSLSSDYPAMREIDAQFQLSMLWMDPDDSDQMAQQLKHMELEVSVQRQRLPSKEHLASQSMARLAPAYWAAVRECL